MGKFTDQTGGELENLHLLSRCTPLENFVSLALVDPEI